MTGIYKYTNLINSKVYIGQSNDLERRYNEHLRRYQCESDKEYNSILHKAFRKYGYDNLQYDIIEECDISYLNEREIYWIEYYDSVNNGYNLDAGGHCRSLKVLTKEQLNQIIDLLQNSTLTEQEIATQFNITMQYVSAINVGRYNKQESLSYPLRKRGKFCIKCGVKIDSHSQQYCVKCYNIAQRTVERPQPEQLLQEIAISSFEAVGRKYGVSGNAIKKWCKAYGLPILKAEIKQLYNMRASHSG